MKSNSQKHQRKSLRLHGYRYNSTGAYFVTIATQGRICRFGEIIHDEMCLNAVGQIAQNQWERLADRFSFVDLDEFVVMPNHVHGIIVIREVSAEVGSKSSEIERYGFPAEGISQPHVEKGSLGAIVRAYKSAVSLRVKRMNTGKSEPLWQRNYYEHIIRDEGEWEKIRLYIQANPVNWYHDVEYFRQDNR